MTGFDFATEVISAEDLASRVAELGAAISEDYRGRDPVFVVVLKGSFPFAADLVRHVDFPAEVDFMLLNRFGEGGRVGIAMDLSVPVFDRDVIIVEDVIDTGLTLKVLLRMMRDRGAASVATVALFDKIRRRIADVAIDYRGFEVGDEYLVGYGLDWKGLYRNLPSVWAFLDHDAFVHDPGILADALWG
ncbi:MAG: hypoxanthine phosphoribosyltransferase [Actinomycetes bacterium]|nr:MAG: hypoxanthine phosphoribosyltransferase [Actinomycetota bacterium]